MQLNMQSRYRGGEFLIFKFLVSVIGLWDDDLWELAYQN